MSNSPLGATSAAYTFEEAPAAAPPAAAQPAPYAGFFVRLSSYVIDNLICLFTVRLTLWGAVTLYRTLYGVELGGDFRFGLAALAFGALFFAVYFIYFFANGGQTPGKRMLGIKVVAIDGGEVDGLRAFMRTAGYAFSWLFFGLGYLWAGFDRHRQTWHDKFAGTVVLEI